MGGGADEIPYYRHEQQVQRAVVQKKDKWFDFYSQVRNYVPDWFIFNAFIVGAVTLGVVFLKFSPFKKYVAALFCMWAKFFREDDKK